MLDSQRNAEQVQLAGPLFSSAILSLGISRDAGNYALPSTFFQRLFPVIKYVLLH